MKTANGKAATDTAGDTPVSLTQFGKNVYMKACKLALTTIAQVAGVDTEIGKLQADIGLRKEGNAAKLHKLALECVKLTVKNGVAMLEDAALLFRDACKAAEEDYIAKFQNAHPEATEARIQVLVPSWSVLKSDFANAMAKAKINPEDHVKPSDVREAYKAWKSANEGEKDGRGRKFTGNRKAGAPIVPSVTETMGATLKAAMNSLIGTIQGLSAESQDEAAKIIAEATKQITKLVHAEPAEDASTGSRTAAVAKGAVIQPQAE